MVYVDEHEPTPEDTAEGMKRAKVAAVEWRRILQKYKEGDMKKSIGLERLVQSGLPAFLRKKVYSMLMYGRFEVDYGMLRDEECKYEYQIDVDIQRTFRSHFMYKERYGTGQCRLFHVLVAFANYMPSIGYCQGMSNIAGLILMYFGEEEGFFLLVNIIRKNNLEALFDKNLSKMSDVISCQDAVFRRFVPEIYRHLRKEGVDLSICAYSWYLTLFTRFRIEISMRIWDMFMFYDFSVLLYIAASLLKYFRKKLLLLRGESLVEFLSSVERFDIEPGRLIGDTKKLMHQKSLDFIRKQLGIKRG